MKKLALVTLSFALIAIGLVTRIDAVSAQLITQPNEQTIADAYIYLLGRALVIRQEHMDRGAPGFAYNTIKYNPIGSADWVNPNLDTAYLEAWFAIDGDSSVIFEVPEIKDRYYTAQILDEWGEVITNINERIFPSKPFGKFALVYPNSTVQIPSDAARIELHSGKAKLLGRVEIKGDKEHALKLQQAFKATVSGTPTIKPPPAMRMFDNKNLIGVEIFDDIDTRLSSALDVAPNAAEMQQKTRAAAAYAASSQEARAKVDAQIRKIIPEFEEYAFTKSAPYRNHWVGGAAIGNYGANYRLRAVANYAGIWANTIDEVIYFVATRDFERAGAKRLEQLCHPLPRRQVARKRNQRFLVRHFVGVPDYRVVPNPLNRFNLNNYSPLQKDADGSLKIAIGPKPVSGVPESNWLPSPEAKPFSLTFRTYVPKDIVKRGEWTPPAVQRLN